MQQSKLLLFALLIGGAIGLASPFGIPTLAQDLAADPSESAIRKTLDRLQKDSQPTKAAMSELKSLRSLAQRKGFISLELELIITLAHFRVTRQEEVRSAQADLEGILSLIKKLNSYSSSLKIEQLQNLQAIQISALCQLVDVHKMTNEFERAFAYNQECLKLANELNQAQPRYTYSYLDTYEILANLNAAKLYSDHLKDNVRSKESYERALALAHEKKLYSVERDILLSMAEAAYEYDEYEHCLKLLGRVLKLLEHDDEEKKSAEARALTLVGIIAAVNQKDYPRAFEFYRKALAAARESKLQSEAAQGKVHIMLAQAYLLSGQAQQALKELELGLPMAQQFGSLELKITALLVQGSVLTETGDRKRAVLSLEEALRLATKNQNRLQQVNALRALANVQLKENQYEKFRTEIGKALIISRSLQTPDNKYASTLLNDIGSSYLIQGKLEQARDAFQKAVAADLNNGIAANNYIRVGIALTRRIDRENVGQADRFCSRSDILQSATSLGQCALALLQTNRPGRALGVIQRALDSTDSGFQKAYILYLKGSILTALERTTESQEAFTQALSQRPERSLEADTYLALGLISGDPAQLNKARDTDPSIAQVSAASMGGRQRFASITGQSAVGGSVNLSAAYVPSIFRPITVNGRSVLMVVDTGAAYTLLNEESRARTGVQSAGSAQPVSFADGRKGELQRYRTQSLGLPDQPQQKLQLPWVLGNPGEDNLLGRDLLVQMLPKRWFKEAQGRP